jgi:outer membrane protein assembly factor BamB
VKLSGGISATPATHPTQALVFVGTHAGTVWALDTRQGLTRWTKAIPTRSDPRILSDLLYVAQTDALVLSSWGGRYCMLEAATGVEQRSWDAGLTPYAAAAADREGNVYCLRAVLNQGVELVRVSREGQATVLHRSPEDKRGLKRALVAAAPVLDEARGRLYFLINQDQGCHLLAWSLASQALVWSHPLPHMVQATPAMSSDGSLLVADLAGEARAIGSDGKARYGYDSGGEYLLAGAVCGADGTCYLGDPLGGLHRIDPRGTGKVLFEARRSLQARPAFGADGRLYVPSTDRTVYVLSPRHSGGR